MRITNTSRYPTPLVKALVEFGSKGVNTTGVLVNVKNSAKHAYAGSAYPNVPRLCTHGRRLKTVKYLVVVRLGEPDDFPTDNMQEVVRWVDLAEGEPYDDKEVRSFSKKVNGVLTWKLQHRVVVTQPYGGKRSPVVTYNDWREALVGVAAHEFRHIHQFRRKKRASESDCERFAAKALERYRQQKGSEPCQSPS